MDFTLDGHASLTPVYHQYAAMSARNAFTLSADTLYAGEEFTITATGDKQAGTPRYGEETRYLPRLAEANPTAAFTQDENGDYAASMALPEGSHTLSVSYQLQYWDSNTGEWLDMTGAEAEKPWYYDLSYRDMYSDPLVHTQTLELTVVPRPAVDDTKPARTPGDGAAPGPWLALALGGAAGAALLCRRRKAA